MEVKSGLPPLKNMKDLFSGERRVRLIVALGILGMLLVLLSQCVASPETKKTGHENGMVSTEEYTKALEKKLTTLLGSIEGVGKAQVMLTLESSAQMIYATEDKVQTERMQDVSGEDKKKEQVSDQTQSSLVLVDRGSGQKQPLIKTQMEPVVKGVVVVCAGADSKVVTARIVDAVTTALGVGANKVCVAKGGT